MPTSIFQLVGGSGAANPCFNAVLGITSGQGRDGTGRANPPPFLYDCVASAAEALVKHLVTRFVVSGVSELFGSYLFVREINYVR
ncbi:hypothetical protein BLA50215_07921 [Burkholderia lata]|uniref:hypothetical protein n=1 Tax=Burkholderia lata (strain ATCC 17760 / DSM 23089 / LMG 22485 / NCIMB 9086 / R18194 / 383) TaxID=482957 RepID=UPI00145443A8|nr:hypothetical protein [Burkholderia lata]VWD64864.1 hypothetical protein BLA50215_07921 [Burkholderia lata]